jgi:very-short-patch-repair endonuclease
LTQTKAPSLSPQAKGRVGEGLKPEPINMDTLRTRARQLRNNATDAERHLWQHLRQKQLNGFRFRRQMPISGYIADFVCPEMRLIVELDGGQHSEQVVYDMRRTNMLAAAGYRLLRYWNDDVLLRTDAVLEDVLRNLLEIEGDGKNNVKSTPPQPSPALRARKGAKSEQDKD